MTAQHMSGENVVKSGRQINCCNSIYFYTYYVHACTCFIHFYTQRIVKSGRQINCYICVCVCPGMADHVQPVSIHLKYMFMHLHRFFIQLHLDSVLSRVGDRSTAIILHAQVHFVDFCFRIFTQNIRPKYAPPRRGKYK